MSEQRCHCLCPKHRDDGMFCTGGAGTVAVWLTGGVIELDRPVWMCPPCASWWQVRRPDRVVAAR